MSEQLSEEEKKDLQEMFGQVLGENFAKLIQELRRAVDINKAVADARYENINTKLDTIINEVRK